MRKINYSENRNVYMPNLETKKALLRAYQKVFEYPDYKNENVNKSVSNYFRVDNSNFTVTNGSLEGINLLLQVFKLKKATLFQPTFWGYEDALTRYGYEIDNQNLDEFLNYNLNKINEKAKKSDVIVICNPNNPTLSFISKNDFSKIISENKKCHFIVDETMLIFDKDFFKKTMITEISKHDNLSVVISFSKFLGIAGLRTGGVFSNRKIIEMVKSASIPYSFGIIQQEVLPVAFSDSKYLEETKNSIEINRKKLSQELIKLGCKIIDCKTNFILVKLPNNSTANEVTSLLLKENMIVRNLKEAYPLLEGEWIRISIQTPENNEILVKKMMKIIK